MPTSEPSPPEAAVPRRPPPSIGKVNLFLIGGSVIVFLFSAQGENMDRLLPLLISLFPAYSPGCLLEVRHGELWRLFTPSFIHFGIAHLGFNMLGLKNIGDPMEYVHGTRFYLLLVAVLALCSNLAQYFFTGSSSFGGMSGVLYGLFGYLWTRALADPAYPLRMPASTIVLSLLWFAACFFPRVIGIAIANYAHAAGLALGAAWGYAAGRRATGRLTARPAGPVVDFQSN